MDVHVNSKGQIDTGIVFQRGLMQFWVPSNMQPHLPYNPRHAPALRTYVMFHENLVAIIDVNSLRSEGPIETIKMWLKD